MNALIFPGQGTQTVGMLQQDFESSPRVREIVGQADEVLGYDLSKIMFEGPADELQRTVHAQPAIYVASCALHAVVEKPVFMATAGHSLGEYTALVAAKAMTFEDGLRLVDVRARAMQDAADKEPGTMAAIIGLEDSEVDEICRQVTNQGNMVVSANFNAPGQVVVSGRVGGVEEVMENAKSSGAKMVRELDVAGAFHSPLMASAGGELAKALEETEINNAIVPVYANVTGRPVVDAEVIRTLLLRQLTGPVLWSDTIRNMHDDGITSFTEVGVGNVLSGLVRRTVKGVEINSISSTTDK